MIGLLAHGPWIDDLGVPFLVAIVFAVGVIRGSVVERLPDGTCPYCGAPDQEEVLEAPRRAGEDDMAPVARCGRCGFRLATRLSPAGATRAAAAADAGGAE